jgi:hypothetical protein
MKHFHRLASVLALAATGTSATAQSSNTLAQERMRDSRFQAGILIPFGSAGSTAERAPRLEAWSEPGTARTLRLRTDAASEFVQPVRLGITLNQHPRMIRNGQEVPGQTDRHHVSALGWVGITVGVAAVVVGAALLGAFGQCLTPC